MSRTMYTFAIGLLLVALQVSCDAAPSGLIPEPTPDADVSQGKPSDVSLEMPADVPQENPANVFQEKLPDVTQEKHLEKRAGK